MTKHNIFSVLGVEIEYMLIDKETMQVRPVSDLIIHDLAGHQSNSVSINEIEISNELVLHVIELKNPSPKMPDAPFEKDFQDTILHLQPYLASHHLMLLPTGAHLTMDPHKETKRWPHGDRSIYEQFDRVFDCKGHGWANLQSMHINLPFANDEEFSLLHNTVRPLLPLLPALASSTPILEGKPTGYQCTRLVYYEKNQEKIPSITGELIPDFITSEAEYHEKILQPMFRDIKKYDPKGLLQYEWLNSRGVIPKFERNSLEIRTVDTQECVNADLAIAKAVHFILKNWCETNPQPLENPCDTKTLKKLHDATVKNGLSVEVSDKKLLSQWNLNHNRLTVREIWSKLIEQVSPQLSMHSQQALSHILSQGNLSERILKSCGQNYSLEKLNSIQRRLSECLLTNTKYP